MQEGDIAMECLIAWLTSLDWLTIVSIILSGLISLAISWGFFYWGNRNSLTAEVICPIISLLEDTPSPSGNREFDKLLRNYNMRYLRKKEMRVLRELAQAYKDVSGYNEDSVKVACLMSYFDSVLRNNEIDPTPVPIRDDEDEIIDWDHPDGIIDLKINVRRTLERYPFEETDEWCQHDINRLFEEFAKNLYGANDIKFFTKHSIEDVFKKSKIRKKWNKRQETFDNAKQKFSELKIVTGVVKPEERAS